MKLARRLLICCEYIAGGNQIKRIGKKILLLLSKTPHIVALPFPEINDLLPPSDSCNGSLVIFLFLRHGSTMMAEVKNAN